jgi:hypothetical protein
MDKGGVQVTIKEKHKKLTLHDTVIIIMFLNFHDAQLFYDKIIESYSSRMTSVQNHAGETSWKIEIKMAG